MYQKNTTTMKPHYPAAIFLITFFLTSLPTAFSKSPNEERNRRILHQPLLFPFTSSPPPLPPPPPPTPDISDQDEEPFSHELPVGTPTPDQIPQSPPIPAAGTNVAHPVATKPSKPRTKKVAIAIISAIVTSAMLSFMIFYLYKNRGGRHDESRKLVAENSNSQNSQNSRMLNEESRILQQSSNLNFLSVNTAEENTRNIGSPYRKVNWAKRSERYRPSPELQPLPPLTKLPPPPGLNSPPPMTSSDDEREDTSFFTSERTSLRTNSPSYNHVANSVPHSKRTSPRSRFSASSSPDTKPSPYLLGPLQASRTLPYIPKSAKFTASPPPREVQTMRKNEDEIISKVQIPPPPPPPPPPPAMLRKYGAVKTYTPLPISKNMIRPRSKNPSPRASPQAEKIRPVEEEKKGVSSLEKFDAEEYDGSRIKMKALHWDKVRATSDRGTVWDQLNSNSFRLNEDAMESLFGCNSRKSVPREATRKLVLPSREQENRILDAKKSQNIAILLRALNVTREEVSEALLDGNPEGLGAELFETLVKMAPTKEEEIKLKNYNDESSKLGAAERFLKAILDIPFAFKRVEALLYRANFDAEVKYLRKSFQTLEEASEELKNSRLFLKLLEAVLRTGNRMNDGTNRGDAKAFKLDTLLKLVDIKGKDGKTTLLHFVVQEIIRSEGEDFDPTNETLQQKSILKFNEEDFKKQGLQVVAGLSKELGNVKKAAGMDSDVLSSYVSKLETGLQKVRQVMQHENQSVDGKFFVSMKVFLQEAADEISRVKAEERKALSFVKEVTQYFHGDAARQEAQPLRIFMIIRDFLSILDNVCKDVGRMQDRTTMGAGRSFRISAAIPLPVLNRYNVPNYRSSDDDSM